MAEDAQVPTAYASDLSGPIAAHTPDQLLFGHTHHPVAFQQGQTLVRNVWLGYPSDVNPEYVAGRGRVSFAYHADRLADDDAFELSSAMSLGTGQFVPEVGQAMLAPLGDFVPDT